MKKQFLSIITSIFFILSVTILLFSCSSSNDAPTGDVSTDEADVIPVCEKSYDDYPAFVITPCHKADSREVFVRQDALFDRGDGSYDNPYGSLQMALTNAVPGDTIYLLEGIYYGDMYINVAGERDNWITIMPYENAKVVFDGKHKGNGGSCLRPSASSEYILIKGFEIENYEGAGIWTYGGCQYIYIEDMTIHDISTPAFSAYGTEAILGAGDNIFIRDCYFYDIGKDRLSASDHGIYMLDATNWVIDSNMFRTAPGGGIHQFMGYDNKVWAKEIYVTNNIFMENLYHIVLSSCGDFHIKNNIFINAKETDFYILNRVGKAYITDNLFYNAYTKDSEYQKGTWCANTIRDNKVKSYFIFADDPEKFADNVFSRNLLIYESMPFRVKYGGELEEKLTGPDDVPKVDHDNTYTENSFIKPVVNIPALIKSTILTSVILFH